MDQHLCVAVLSFVELLVRNFRMVESNLMGDNKARLCLASDNQIS